MKLVFSLLLVFWAPLVHHNRDGKPLFVQAGFFSAAKVKLEESDIAARLKWERIEPRVQNVVTKVVDGIWPTFNSSAEKLGISTECQYAVDKMLKDLKELKMWAIQMVDATGFHSGGQFFENWSSFGDYDQCLAIQAPADWSAGNLTIRGQYCLVDIQPPLPPKWHTYMRPLTIPALYELQSNSEFIQALKSYGWDFYNRGFRFGVCIPSTCKSEEIESISNYAAGQVGFQANVQSCEKAKPKKVEGYQFAIAIMLAMFVLTGILCSFMNTGEDNSDKKVEKSFPNSLIDAFSAYRNVNQALTLPVTPDPNTAFFNGIKCVAMIWVIAIHMLIVAYQSKILRGHGSLRDKNASWYIQFFTNGQVSVDIFFFITGFLLTYIKFRDGTRCDKKLGGIYSEIVKPVFRRAWRILPMTLLVIGLTFLLPLMGSGPTWNLMINSIGEQCRENWWSILYFGSNFIPFDKACCIQSWYVCVDVQLYVYFSVFAYCYARNRKIAFGSLLATGILSNLWITWETYFYQDPPTLLQYSYDLDKVNDYLSRAHQSPEWHVGVYSAGLALGCFLSDRKSFSISQSKKILGSLTAFFMMIFVFFSSLRWNHGVNPTQFETLLYVFCCKPFVAASISWLTFLCVTGNGGLINSILSWKGFEWFSKFTFLIYLINMPVIFYYFGTSGGLVDSYDSVMFGLGIQFAVISVIIAFWLHVFFESPLIELEKIFRRKTNKNAVNKQQTNENENKEELTSKKVSTRKIIGHETSIGRWKERLNPNEPPEKIGTVSRFT